MSDDINLYGLHGRSRTMEDEEVLGYQDILGAVQEILGAGASSAAVQKSPGFAQALARRVAARAPMTKTVQPTKKRRWPIAFGPTAVPPSTTITATSPGCADTLTEPWESTVPISLSFGSYKAA